MLSHNIRNLQFIWCLSKTKWEFRYFGFDYTSVLILVNNKLTIYYATLALSKGQILQLSKKCIKLQVLTKVDES